MKQRVFLALMMPFLFIKGFAQEVNSTVPSETSGKHPILTYCLKE